mmetsp:Transcript_70221/g.146343  ORF Transcript_70221/g.146343 Transcript_70221/m.146343 type:complete len:631 (+) Transcript_70221:36-1928(+)
MAAESHQLVVRDQNGTFLRPGPVIADYSFPECPEPNALCGSRGDVEYSPDGSLAAVLSATGVGVVVYDTATGAEKAKVACGGALAVSFSPQGSFLQTWEKLTEELQQSGGNLRLWDPQTGAFLTGFSQKAFSKEKWPYIRWTDDEMIACMSITNGVHLYNGQDIAQGVISKVSQENLSSYSISPGPPPYKIVTFVPEVKDKPAAVTLFAYPNLEEPVTRKVMFRASDASFLWSPTGAAVLVRTSTDVDATGKSYYGESKMAYLASDGKSDSNVALGKEGPIHDVAWSPSGKEFIVVYGFMPAKATLFDMKCKAVFDFGTGSRNTVAWAPHGRFVMLGGFGNISGNLEFWDNNRKKVIAAVKAPGTTSWAWSPCSRFFLTATLFPRLRVDNGFKIFKYDGSLVTEQTVPHELYQVSFRPAKPSVHPDRPASPGAGGGAAGGGGGGGGGGQSSAAAAPAAPSAYVPPHLRGKGAGGASARPAFSLHAYEEAAKVGGQSLFGKQLPPGAEEEDNKLSKSALKKKKAKEKAQKEKDAAEALEQTNRALAAAGITPQAAPAAGAAPAAEEKKSFSSADEVNKRIKAVQKKLRQAEALVEEEKGGKELNVDQKDKIASIDGMQEELKELNALLATF